MSHAIAGIIDEAFQIQKRIERDKARLAVLEKAIVAHAQARPEDHQPLEDDEREGRQFRAIGSTVSVPVIFTSDQLVKSFAADSALHARITDAAGIHFDLFFKPEHKFKAIIDDGKAFRAKAREVLGAAHATFISACVARDKDGIPKSATKIDWSRATPPPPTTPA